MSDGEDDLKIHLATEMHLSDENASEHESTDTSFCAVEKTIANGNFKTAALQIPCFNAAFFKQSAICLK